MRLKLALQRLELRFGQARLQTRSADRPLFGLSPVGNGVTEGDKASQLVASIQSSCVKYCRCA